MQPSDCAIYAVCIPGEEVRYSSRAPLIPIMGGSCELSKEEREKLHQSGYVFDDEGQTFLSPLNSRFGELSCIQWIVNNAEQLNIGNAQYRRNWIEPSDKWYDADTLYVPEFAHFDAALSNSFTVGTRPLMLLPLRGHLPTAEGGYFLAKKLIKFGRKICSLDATWRVDHEGHIGFSWQRYLTLCSQFGRPTRKPCCKLKAMTSERLPLLQNV